MKKLLIFLMLFSSSSLLAKNYVSGITYSAITADTRTASPVMPTVSCSGGFTESDRVYEPFSIQKEIDSCKRWHGWAGVGGQISKEVATQQYDTLRRFVESCAKNDPDCHDVFPALNSAVYSYAPNDTTRYDKYRAWLISVLYLNTIDPYYFCACMIAIAGTYQYGGYNPINSYLAVLKYLMDFPYCNDQGLRDAYTDNVRYRHESWLSGDRKTPEDTTLPSLDSLGLGFLLTHNGALSPTTSHTVNGLLRVNTSPNPFAGTTNLEFELNRMAYTTIAIYDDLGRLVWGDGRGSSLEAGLHTVHIDGKDLPHGTLYARISTGFGEVKTVKLVHE
jgi:hypothetical protein